MCDLPLAQVPLPPGLLSSGERLCILPPRAQNGLVWTVSSLYWGTYNFLWKILGLFICDSFTLEISNLSEVIHCTRSPQSPFPYLILVFFSLCAPVRKRFSLSFRFQHSILCCPFACPMAMWGASCIIAYGQGEGIPGWWQTELVAPISALPYCGSPGNGFPLGNWCHTDWNNL